MMLMSWLSSMKSGQPNTTLRGVPFASFILSLLGKENPTSDTLLGYALDGFPM
jgi:hypothetical protein